MVDIGIELDGDRRSYRPGERVSGRVNWTGSASARLELLWTTRGRGDADTQVIGSLNWTGEAALPQSRPFVFDLPAAPWSFSGKLVALIWRLRLVLDGGLETAADIVVSPTDLPVDLHAPAAG
ncbi:MAG: hypothetical protein ABSH20_12150 [Tepidisphaeraceae bacterium]